MGTVSVRILEIGFNGEGKERKDGRVLKANMSAWKKEGKRTFQLEKDDYSKLG